MNYERTRAIVVAHLRLAMEQIDANSRAEVVTDAGTKDPHAYDEGPDPDLERDRKYETGEWE